MQHRNIVILCVLLASQCVLAFDPPNYDWDAAYKKAAAYIQNFSVAQKVNLTTGVGWQGGPCVGNIPAISERGFPGLCLEDSPTGVRFTDGASAFPAGINVAATWDRALMNQRGAAMGAEFRGKGVNIALTPMMNLGRVAAGGRNWEGAGADPWLAGEASAQSIIGLQSTGVMACAKHYILNEQEHSRNSESSNIDDRTIHELYLWPFMQSVRAGAASVMCSYNKVNNTFACENDRTLNQLLKKELGFKGFIMSDWAATRSGVPSVLAGLDMTMPGDITFGSHTSYFGQNLVNAVNNGQVSMDRLNDMATRILAPWFLLNQDSNFPKVNFDFRDPSKGSHVNVSADHYKLIRQIGADSNILLKNEKEVLPLPNSANGGKAITFAIIGSDAGPPQRGPNGCPDHGCIDGTLAQGWGSGTTNFPYLIDPLKAIQARANTNKQSLKYLENNFDINTAKQVAANAEYAIVFSLADSGEEYITVDGNMGDRNNLSLWNNGDELINAVASVNTKTIVVIHTVGPVLMPWIDNPNILAVIVAGLPGQESGNSLVDVLFGDVNPSGKLVYTIAKQRSDYSADVIYQNPNQIDYTEKLFIDYRWFDFKNIEPQFEFGFGLSYTTFGYSDLKVTKNGDAVTVTVVITNTGKIAGKEVSQLYIGFPASAEEPPKVLRGFEKTALTPGQSTTVTYALASVDISIWDVTKQAWVVPSGEFTVYVGASSRDIRQKATFDV